MIYTSENMDRLLFERHIGQKVRRSGGKTGTMKKRTSKEDENFEISLKKLLNELEKC